MTYDVWTQFFNHWNWSFVFRKTSSEVDFLELLDGDSVVIEQVWVQEALKVLVSFGDGESRPLDAGVQVVGVASF